jgi:hypothetical protein
LALLTFVLVLNLAESTLFRVNQFLSLLFIASIIRVGALKLGAKAEKDPQLSTRVSSKKI